MTEDEIASDGQALMWLCFSIVLKLLADKRFEKKRSIPECQHHARVIPKRTPMATIENKMAQTFSAIARVDVPTDRVIDGRNILPYMENQIDSWSMTTATGSEIGNKPTI